jgi:hypothetical protein
MWFAVPVGFFIYQLKGERIMYPQDRGQLVLECLFFLTPWLIAAAGVFAFGNWLIGG